MNWYVGLPSGDVVATSFAFMPTLISESLKPVSHARTFTFSLSFPIATVYGLFCWKVVGRITTWVKVSISASLLSSTQSGSAVRHEGQSVFGGKNIFPHALHLVA